MRYLWLAIFWAMQLTAHIFFKGGTFPDHPERKVPFFILGNILGAGSVWILMRLYELMNVNVALAIGGGGAFFVVQIVLAIIFRSQVTPVMAIGILAIAAGMIMVGLGTPASAAGG